MSDTTQQSDNDIAGEPKPNASANEDLGQVQRQRDEYFDQLQRTRAEFMNFQKRSKTQADSDRVYAVGSLARDLLDGIDNLERANEALKSTASAGIHEGLDMVHKQLLAILAKHGVEPIEALGKPFDPNEHDALVQQPDAHHPDGTVVNELSKGYRIRDRVLRPSKVAVSVKPAQS
ncbi:nucleotide exchange factor GrpE [Singulisphaera sp. Ch08]|uniref:Protein GrpE n=1 Tax=Singulisphaera sp. Ch08 TaxID=3120278 RepID=A0AAU7CCA6_9BACT